MKSITHTRHGIRSQGLEFSSPGFRNICSIPMFAAYKRIHTCAIAFHVLTSSSLLPVTREEGY